MSLPVRSLPVLHNWDCHGCGLCCRTYAVPVSDAEQKRIEAQGWADDPELKGVSLFTPSKDGTVLAHRADDACVFLGPDDRCRIHAKHGAAAKPMACRVYPFVLVPAGDHWRVGVRFACPSAADNKGRPMRQQSVEAREYAELLEADKGVPKDLPPPPLQPGQMLPWMDLVRLAGTLAELVSADAPMERKLRQALTFAALCRPARFEALSGGRLSEFFTVMSAAAVDETAADPTAVLQPGWGGRMMFRQAVAVYTRKDVGHGRGEMAKRGAFGRAAAAWRFAVGRGRVPKLHSLIPDGATFDQADRPLGRLPADAEGLLTRYYRTKLESLQFCGRPNFGLAVWDGLESLVLTFPAAMWLARLLVANGRPVSEAVSAAVRVVDDNFGYNPLLGRSKQTAALRVLGMKGELPKLVGWYGR